MKCIYPVLTCMALLLTGCFTGIESTPTITADDVEKALSRMGGEVVSPLVAPVDSVASWRAGKCFVVTDNQARRLFLHSREYDIDTIDLAGRVLQFTGYDMGDRLGNERSVNLNFTDGTHDYTFATGRHLEDLSSTYRVPLLIDLDMVSAAAEMLRGKRLYVMSRLWYDPASEQLRAGRQYVPVTILDVQAGNKVLPLRVLFEWESDTAMVWMSDGVTLMPGRDYASLFATVDPRVSNGGNAISDEHWDLITRGEVCVAMTKPECRLSLGAPLRILTDPDQNGLRERWDYGGGSYLFFIDGILDTYR